MRLEDDLNRAVYNKSARELLGDDAGIIGAITAPSPPAS
jgi:hypothetical protein